MDGCTKGPQLEEVENLNTRALRTRRTPLGGTSALAGQVQEGPSPAFMKQNINVLRTMIKELDNRGQEKVTPRRLFNGGSGGSRASQRKSSSDSGYDTVSDSGLEDLSMPYRWPKTMPFTFRITRFRYHRRAKLPPNIMVYEGNKDLEDHLSIFSDAAEQEEWHMPVWYKIKFSHKSGASGVKDIRVHAYHPELAKKLNDKIPKTVNEMWERVSAFIRGETTADTTKVIKSPH
ncbi:hypothetical protein Tco_1217187 [Tanacetum coccineum]